VSDAAMIPFARDDVPLAWYGAFTRRSRWLLVAAVAAGLLAGTGWAALPGQVYTATVEVLAPHVPLGGTPGTARSSTIDTEAQLLTSGAVAAAAAAALGDGLREEDVRDAVDVRAPLGTRALVVRYRAGTPEAARRGAVEVGRQYVALRGGLQRRQSRAQIARLSALVATLARHQAADGLEDSVQYRLHYAALQTPIRELDQARAAVGAAPVLLPGAPAVTASLRGEAVRPVTGALLGLLAGVGIGLLRRARP
jgi:hypothetical protein